MASNITLHIKTGNVHAYIERNYSRTHESWRDLFLSEKEREPADGDSEPTVYPRELIRLATLIAGGWNPQHGFIGVTPITGKAAEKDKKLAAAQRKKLVAEIMGYKEGFQTRVGDQTVTVTMAHLEKALAETLPLDAEVTHDVVWGFRRFYSLIFANAIRLAMGEEPMTTLDFVVKVYTNEADRRIDNVLENTGKNDGVRRLSKADIIKAGRDLFEQGVKESMLRKVFKDGTGQKLYATCSLDQSHPELKLVDRLITGQLAWDPLDKEELRKLVSSGAASGDVSSYFENPKGTNSNQTKMAKRKDIDGLKNHGVEIVRFVAKAILADDLGALNVLLKHKDGINTAVRKAFGGALPTPGKVEEAEEAETAESEEEEEPKAKKARRRAAAAE
jgi:hypothetical protein